jgi:vancomycin resistance protein VanJ
MMNFATKSESFWRRSKFLGVSAVLVLCGLWIVGQLFRDSTRATGILFYIPSPLVLVVCLVGGYFAWRARRRKIAMAMTIGALASAVFVFGVENQFRFDRKPVPSTETVRLLHWNVFYGHAGWDGLMYEIRQAGPDICVLSEVPNWAELPKMSRYLGDDYTAIRFGHMAVVARGSLEDGHWFRRKNGLRAFGLVWKSDRGSFRVLVVDLDSNIIMAREPRLLAMTKIMVDWDADIVVGDFNAPRRSRALSPLPSGFVHAYDAVGSGWSYTWPVPCPLYAIDQCILGKRIRPVAYELESSPRSDHRRQVLDFAVED